MNADSTATAGSLSRQTPYDKHFEYRKDFMDIAPRFFLRTQLMLKMLVGLPGSVLDVGCGDGFFMRRLARLGYRAIGIDVSELAIDLARRVLAAHPHCEVHCTPIESFGPDAHYGLVTCGETLEHIEDDRAFLHQIQRLMRPGGTLVLTVPIDMSLWTEHDTRAGHFRRYAKAELFEKLAQAGFSIEQYVVWGFPFVRLMHFEIRKAQDRRIEVARASNSRKRDLLMTLKPLLAVAKYGILVDNLFNFTERGVGIVVRAKKVS